MVNDRNMKKLLNDLQKLVGSKPKLEISTFHNWADTQVRNEIISVSPTSVQEVQAVVKAARKLGVRVRAAGSTHSWTPLFTDEGNIVMHVRDIKRPDGPQLELIQSLDDPDGKLVTMATGVNIQEFLDFLMSHGVCISANVILRVVQMGGIVAPACHGVGSDVKTISDDVVKMRIVNSDGDLIEYSIDKDEEMMRAVQANMGFWGIIIDITMKVNPMVIVETDNVWIKVKDIFYDKDKFHGIVKNNWSVEIFWFPFNGISNWEAIEASFQGKIDLGEWDPMEDEVWLRIINKPSNVGPVKPNSFYKSMDFNAFVQVLGFDLVDQAIARCPQFAPLFLRTQVQEVKKAYSEKITQQLPHAIHYRDYAQAVPVYDMEWAIPINNDFSNVMQAIQHTVDVVKQEALGGKFPMNLPLEMRFVADSDVYMAPNGAANPKYGGSGHSVYIEVLTIANTPGWSEFCQKIADNWMANPGARVHWCKEWSFLNGIDDFIRKSYSQVLPQYLSCLERSGADPDGIFFNDRLEKIFYPKGHSGWAKVKAEQRHTAANGSKDEPNKKSRLCQIL